MSMFGNIFGMMKDFGEIKQKVKTLKEEISKMEFEGKSEDGSVIAVVSGDCFVRSISCINSNTTQQAILEAVNRGLAQAKQAIGQKISEVTGGLPEDLI